MRKTYKGVRMFEPRKDSKGNIETVRDTASSVTVWVQTSDRTTHALPPRTDIRNHSPDGFNWGYGGRGPAQLALAICVDALGVPQGSRPAVYQAFKRQFVAKWKDQWQITSGEVVDWFLETVFSSAPPVEVGDE